ncbi:MAG: hypothetical protein COX57_07925 [Alphaproteobacteria bacterium CG_4_10_14_0_2_um_filter_63_37]|nr:MAG: hypothetical protein AUJ55_03780 [Proteobacteria bacterium CG1_02_64_396]PJA24547.1 MAG: hypothetical protein COX57_07925 [Alphaproteobacteria bacterium CG_4_10_14_0_2_um_filter_63_37]
MKKNVLWMLLSVFSIQGAAYIGQLILAGMLTVEGFATVRTVEATLQVLATVAPLGMSLLVVRLASQSTESAQTGRVLTSYMTIAGVSALIVASLGAAVVALHPTPVGEYFGALVWVVVLTSVGRTALNYFYGKERFGLISVTTFVASAASLGLLVVLVDRWQMDGWVFSRYVAEGLVVLAGIYFVGPMLSRHRMLWGEIAEVCREGVAVSASLIFRSAIDNAPFLIFAFLAASQVEIAIYGMCTLLVAGAMILPSSLVGVMLPRYGKIQQNAPEELLGQHRKYERYVALSGVVVALALVGLGLLAQQFSGKFSDVYPYIAIVAMIVPIRALAALNGNILFVRAQTAIGARINIICAVAIVVLSLFSGHVYGLWGVIVASLLSEFAAMVVFRLYANKSAVRR